MFKDISIYHVVDNLKQQSMYASYSVNYSLHFIDSKSTPQMMPAYSSNSYKTEENH